MNECQTSRTDEGFHKISRGSANPSVPRLPLLPPDQNFVIAAYTRLKPDIWQKLATSVLTWSTRLTRIICLARA